MVDDLHQPQELLLQRVHELVSRARMRGVRVSVDQTAGLLEGLALVDALSRDALRRLVRLTLAGSADDLPVLDAIVDQVFPATPTDPDATRSTTQVQDHLMQALTAGDAAVAALAGAEAADLAVGAPGEVLPTARRGAQRVLRALDLSALLRRAAEQEGGGAHQARQHQEALAAFEAALLDELKRRGAQAGPASAADEVPDDPLDAELLHMSAAELRAMRELVRPLARRLAARARRRRRLSARGRLDVPRTQRRALGTGGVPLDPVLRRRRTSRPRVVALCDVSGSMADHARFMLALLQALLDELPGLRTFVFVDGIADVTELLSGPSELLDARALLMHPGVVLDDGHTDYGAVFAAFATTFGDVLDSRTTLVVLGDARARGLDPQEAVFAQLARKAGTVQWLNPEPPEQWPEDDSEALTYGAHCTAMHEVRTLRQLAQWVETLI